MKPPERIQRKRSKGWRLPPNTVCVSRPGKWGNPFSQCTQADNAAVFRSYALGNTLAAVRLREIARRELRGKNLACWCKPGTPCHADTLLEIANA